MLPSPLAPPLSCNRPPSDLPPAPDGCPDWTPIAPPPAPVPPPCIAGVQVRQWDEGGTAVAELAIYVDHPEINWRVKTYTQLARYQFRKSQPALSGVEGSATCPEPCRRVRDSEWELVDADWEVSCGKDEGPLTWALFQVLNAAEWDALDIYTSPLPEEYMAVLRELASLRNLVYMPVILND